jgi:pimeloyl-ACP methyl ester carboxylesterase
LKSKPVVLFIKGLNTYGDDNLRLGPFVVGSYWQNLAQQLFEFDFHPVPNLKHGTIEEIVNRADQYLLSNGLYENPEIRLHILGHSLGGLVARALAHNKRISSQVSSVSSIGTSHFGTNRADLILYAGKRIKFMTKILRYDLEGKKKFFKIFSQEGIQQFNETYPDLNHIRYGSIVTSLPFPQLTFALRLASFFGAKDQVGDGLVSESSQKWGHEIGRYQLDHIEQMGYCLKWFKKPKIRFRSEFEKMCKDYIQFLKSF